MKKTDDITKKPDSEKPVQYIVVVDGEPLDRIFFTMMGPRTYFFTKLSEVSACVKKYRTATSVRVFKIEEELKTRVGIELDL